MECPKCDSTLKTLDFEPDLQVERCGACKGIWMDKGELARYANTPTDLPPGTYEKGMLVELACPSCKVKGSISGLYQGTLTPGLSLDFCKSCEGLWFDNRELSSLQNYLKQIRIQAKLKKASKT